MADGGSRKEGRQIPLPRVATLSLPAVREQWERRREGRNLTGDGFGPSRVRRRKDGRRAAHLPIYLWAYPVPGSSKQGGGFSVGASVFLLYDSPLREEVHEGGESAGDNRSSGCNHPHRHLAQASWLVVATYPAPPKRSPFLRPQLLYTLSVLQ